MLTTLPTVNYIGICGCAAGLGPLAFTTTQTFTACGCAADFAAATVPMTTTTTLCAVCGPSGGPQTVTLTLPVGAPAAATGGGAAAGAGAHGLVTVPYTGAAAARLMGDGVVGGVIAALGIVGVGMGLL